MIIEIKIYLLNYHIPTFVLILVDEFILILATQPSSPIIGGHSPGTQAKLKDKIMLRAKVVVALYPFRAIESGDLSLEKVSDFNVCIEYKLKI